MHLKIRRWKSMIREEEEWEDEDWEEEDWEDEETLKV